MNNVEVRWDCRVMAQAYDSLVETQNKINVLSEAIDYYTRLLDPKMFEYENLSARLENMYESVRELADELKRETDDLDYAIDSYVTAERRVQNIVDDLPDDLQVSVNVVGVDNTPKAALTAMLFSGAGNVFSTIATQKTTAVSGKLLQATWLTDAITY